MAEPQEQAQGQAQVQTMRLDRFLWWARLARTRSAAQAIAEAGTLRLDGRRIDRAHAPVRPGSVLAFVQNGQVRVLRVVALPRRRGPPAEAATLYDPLEPGGPRPVDEVPSPA